MLVGEPYWRREPPDQATLEGCHGIGMQDWLPLPELIESFGLLGCDVVEMVLSAIPEVLRVTLCETGGRRPLTAASPGAGSKLPATSTRRRGGDQYAPGQRVRQRSGKRDRAAGGRLAVPAATTSGGTNSVSSAPDSAPVAAATATTPG